jgi:hypothetical protein
LKHIVIGRADAVGLGRFDRQVHPGRKHRYDLATALRVVRQMETSAGRGAVFDEIKAKNRLYRLVDEFYSQAGKTIGQPLLLFAYMLKCVLSVGPFSKENALAVSISNFDNEHRTIARIAALLPEVPLQRITVERRHAFALAQISSAARMLASAKRLWPFLQMLARSHGFMPAARIASSLAFYMRFSELFAASPALRAAIIASNYSPEAVGMAAAAHRHGRRVIYSNHAPVPANGAVVPPVLADCALFYGDVVRQTYERRSECSADVALFGLPTVSKEMEWRSDLRCVGIFLTSGTRTGVVSRIVAAIRSTRPEVRILIRNHPVALLKNDLSDLSTDDPNLEITIGNPLDVEIAACDLIICGNSGVALNAVSAGRPVAYVPDLDHVKYDSNGFVQSGLVCEVSDWSDDIYDRLKAFYQEPGWRDVMTTYDAAFGRDRAQLASEAAETLKRYI